ncbi:hypothetical protein [Cohnella sp. 56]|uniref:hypothetical protein n=1 Tax=Cohnella sp. 56 TaxID=3113722 RepID=UPI0030E94498
MGEYEEKRTDNSAAPAANGAGAGAGSPGKELTERDKLAFARFSAALGSLKGLDLTGIEPTLPPTYKAARYRT